MLALEPIVRNGDELGAPRFQGGAKRFVMKFTPK